MRNEDDSSLEQSINGSHNHVYSPIERHTGIRRRNSSFRSWNEHPDVDRVRDDMARRTRASLVVSNRNGTLRNREDNDTSRIASHPSRRTRHRHRGDIGNDDDYNSFERNSGRSVGSVDTSFKRLSNRGLEFYESPRSRERERRSFRQDRISQFEGSFSGRSRRDSGSSVFRSFRRYKNKVVNACLKYILVLLGAIGGTAIYFLVRGSLGDFFGQNQQSPAASTIFPSIPHPSMTPTISNETFQSEHPSVNQNIDKPSVSTPQPSISVPTVSNVTKNTLLGVDFVGICMYTHAMGNATLSVLESALVESVRNKSHVQTSVEMVKYEELCAIETNRGRFLNSENTDSVSLLTKVVQLVHGNMSDNLMEDKQILGIAEDNTGQVGDAVSMATGHNVIVQKVFTVSAQSVAPTSSSSLYPSVQPTAIKFSLMPNILPSQTPSFQPVQSPLLSALPTMSPSSGRSQNITAIPSEAPSWSLPTTPSAWPSHDKESSAPKGNPSDNPSLIPSLMPSRSRSKPPTVMPARTQSIPPTESPSLIPSPVPSRSHNKPPTVMPVRTQSIPPTESPSSQPHSRSLAPQPSLYPTFSHAPSDDCAQDSSDMFFNKFLDGSPIYRSCDWLTRLTVTHQNKICSKTKTYDGRGPAKEVCRVTCGTCPILTPSLAPTQTQSREPGGSPSPSPSLIPTAYPTTFVQLKPTQSPSNSLLPSVSPTRTDSMQPSESPSSYPSLLPTSNPTASAIPSVKPTRSPLSTPAPTMLGKKRALRFNGLDSRSSSETNRKRYRMKRMV